MLLKAASRSATVTCYDNNRFEVEYTFTDELAKLMDLIEERGADVA